MNTQLKPKLCPDRLFDQPLVEFQIGDRVEIAGMSHHQGRIVDIKDSKYSGLTYSVRVYGEIHNKLLEGVNPLALTKLC